MNGLHKDSICFYEYYLKIPDYRVPKSCKLVDSVWSTVFDVFACLLAGDDEEVYWCCGRLADRSIVVMDGKVMVEARYQEVDIENNGTVHLTVIPGKVKTVKL